MEGHKKNMQKDFFNDAAKQELTKRSNNTHAKVCCKFSATTTKDSSNVNPEENFNDDKEMCSLFSSLMDSEERVSESFLIEHDRKFEFPDHTVYQPDREDLSNNSEPTPKHGRFHEILIDEDFSNKTNLIESNQKMVQKLRMSLFEVTDSSISISTRAVTGNRLKRGLRTNQIKKTLTNVQISNPNSSLLQEAILERNIAEQERDLTSEIQFRQNKLKFKRQEFDRLTALSNMGHYDDFAKCL